MYSESESRCWEVGRQVVIIWQAQQQVYLHMHNGQAAWYVFLFLLETYRLSQEAESQVWQPASPPVPMPSLPHAATVTMFKTVPRHFSFTEGK